MASKITIEQMSIAGFRAYLQAQTLKLRDGNTVKNLAVYAPNAKGKSSLVDAIDFFLSSEGTLQRLGQRRAGTHAGPEALEHVDARRKGVQPQVSMHFRDGSDSFGDTRLIPSQGMCAITQAASRLCMARKIDFIIRGYELRRFVEDCTSQQRYADVSKWFSLSPLVDIQNNLRTLRIRVNRTLDEDAAMKERLRDLHNITDKTVARWDEAQVLDWVNKHQVHKLDATLTLPALDKANDVYKNLEQRKSLEEQQIGLTAIKAAASSIRTLFEKSKDTETETGKETGAIAAMEAAHASLGIAREKEANEKGAAERSVFKDIWEAAERLFEQQPDIDECPLCRTPFEEMPPDRSQQIAPHIKTELAGLKAYRDAVTALQVARQSAQQGLTNVVGELNTCKTLLQTSGYSNEHPAIIEIDNYRAVLAATEIAQPLPESTALKKRLNTALQALIAEQKRVEGAQSEHTYRKVLGKIDDLIAVRHKIANIKKKKGELQELTTALVNTETFMASQLRGYLQHLLDQLKGRMNQFYEGIQAEAGKIPAIRLDLDEAAKQPQLHLLVDFAPNREGVMPSGYLSDSQLHTLALSLRLAAIEMANKDVPIIVLDDIVSSYDADHRKAIAGVIAAELQDFQVIIATHDEQFFRYLQDHLPARSWYFKRITALEEDFGPRFHDHKVTAQTIQAKWDNGESAANEIRQAEEEWLLAKAREFGVSVRIREVHSAHQYDRGEIARALHSFLKETDVQVPKVTGIVNPFLLSLQKGDVENFGSHFSDNPNAWASTGDERKRWAEFEEFRSHFICQSCGHLKFKRPKTDVKKALCDKCETPFAFGARRVESAQQPAAS